jgi:hypothetical protein
MESAANLLPFIRAPALPGDLPVFLAFAGQARRRNEDHALALEAHPAADGAAERSGDLVIRVGPGIFRVRDQPIDRPPFDLVRRPRPLISGSLARGRAGEGKCWRVPPLSNVRATVD